MSQAQRASCLIILLMGINAKTAGRLRIQTVHGGKLLLGCTDAQHIRENKDEGLLTASFLSLGLSLNQFYKI